MSTQGVAPGGSPDGLNPRKEPQVIDFYKDNIPRGSDFRIQQYWRTATPSQPAKLITPTAGPYEFSRGYDDTLELVLNDGLIDTLQFGTRSMTSNEVRDELLTKWGTQINVTIDSIGRLVLETILTSTFAKIRVVAGSANSTFGWANETVARGIDQVSGVSPRILDNPQQDNYNATTRFYKKILFQASDDFSIGANMIQLNSKESNLFLCGFSELNSLEQLLSVCDSSSVRELTINDRKWYSGEFVYEVPRKVTSVNADYFVLQLVDNMAAPVSTGLNSGELFITVKGWTIGAALV